MIELLIRRLTAKPLRKAAELQAMAIPQEVPVRASPFDPGGKNGHPDFRPLQAMLRAKAASDRGDYTAKHEIMAELIARSPGEFAVDSDDGAMLGVTHKRTKFRMHLPRSIVLRALEMRRRAA